MQSRKEVNQREQVNFTHSEVKIYGWSHGAAERAFLTQHRLALYFNRNLTSEQSYSKYVHNQI